MNIDNCEEYTIRMRVIILDFIKKKLPGLDFFLCDILSKEHLSDKAEAKRCYYVQQLDLIKLPPNIPPRSTHQKNSDLKDKDNSSINNSDLIEEDEHDVVGPSLLCVSDPDTDDYLYEVPENAVDVDNEDRSDKSYEDCDSEENEAPIYQNQGFLPPSGYNRLELDTNKSPFYLDNTGEGVLFRGELFKKKYNKWQKYVCAILSDSSLFCFKSYKDNKKSFKTSLKFDLHGYDAIYLKESGKYCHIMRISRPGCETYWFSHGDKDKLDSWIVHINRAGNVLKISSEVSHSTCDQNSSLISTSQGIERPASSTNLSMRCESGSGDGLVQQQQQTVGKKKRASSYIRNSLSSILNFGKKIQDLSEYDGDGDPDVIKASLLNVHGVVTNNLWVCRLCVLKPGELSVYHYLEEDGVMIRIALASCDLEPSRFEKRKLAVIVKMNGTEIISLDFQNVTDQGKWLSFLITEMEIGEVSSEHTHVNESIKYKQTSIAAVDDDIIYEPDLNELINSKNNIIIYF